MRHKRLVLTTALVFSFLITGCGNQTKEEHKNHEASSSSQSNHSQTKHLANGDIQELTASLDKMPGFLNKQSKDIQTIYQAVPHFKEVLENMPCYCGCGEAADHKNNYDCFVAKNNEDGSIVWDDHGTKCGTCLEIAAVSMSEAAEGKSSLEIRKMIDEKYKDGYAQPTPTPMPKA